MPDPIYYAVLAPHPHRIVSIHSREMDAQAQKAYGPNMCVCHARRWDEGPPHVKDHTPEEHDAVMMVDLPDCGMRQVAECLPAGPGMWRVAGDKDACQEEFLMPFEATP